MDKNGDTIRVGQVTGIVQLRDGVARGTIGIEHGFGHRELGAKNHYIGERLS